MNEAGTVILPVKDVPGYLPGQAGPRVAAEQPTAYLRPDPLPPPWWWATDYYRRKRRGPRCEGTEG